MVSEVFPRTTAPLYGMLPDGVWGHVVASRGSGDKPNSKMARRLFSQAGHSETNKLKMELRYTLAPRSMRFRFQRNGSRPLERWRSS